MIICNNCNTTNEQGTHKCVHCNMVGDFRPADYKPEVVKIKTNMISCRNCGSDTPGEGTKCIHCNFPFAQDQIQARKVAQDDSFQNLKVG